MNLRTARSTLFPYTTLFRSSIVNQGTITAATSGQTISVSGASVTNQGTMQASNGATLSVSNLRSEEHTSELQSPSKLVCRILPENRKIGVTNSTLNLGGSFS